VSTVSATVDGERVERRGTGRPAAERDDARWEECPDCGGFGSRPHRLAGYPIPVICRGCGGRGGWLLDAPVPDAGDGYEVGWP
jgi:DnaJ-class molecular chaperone